MNYQIYDENATNMKNLFAEVNLSTGDTVMVSSDVLKIMIHNKKSKNKIDIDSIIDMIIEKISHKGTLLFPTFNWDFCSGKDFDYKKTLSQCGTLSNIALKRSDFKRTKNPIYSFAVTGKDKDFFCNMPHRDSFSFDSPLGYLIKNNAKNLFINLNYRTSGFPFVHILEQELNLNHRYKKEFSANYIDSYGSKKKETYSLFVRKIEEGIGETLIDKKFDQIMKDKKVFSKQSIINEILDISIIELKFAYELLKKEYLKNKNIMYSAKLE